MRHHGASNPTIDVCFLVSRACYLSGTRAFSLSIKFLLHSPCPITIFTPGSVLDAKAIFSQDKVDIVDAGTQEKIEFPSRGLRGPPHALSAENEDCFVTLIDGNPHYISFSSGHSRRPEVNAFDVTRLAPDRTYTLRFRDNGISWWRYGTKEEVLKELASLQEQLESKPLPLHITTISDNFLKTFADMPQPPKVTVSLSASSSTCFLSGDPPFTVYISFTSHADRPITVMYDRTILTDSGLEFVDVLTGKVVGPEHIDLLLNEGGSWHAEDFLRLEPGKPWVEERTFTTTGYAPDVSFLRKGNEYLVRYQDLSFRWWGYDEVQEVLKYGGDKGSMSSFPFVSPIPLHGENQVRFRAD